MSRLTRRPIRILKKGSSRKRGKDIQRSNIKAAKAIADFLKSTLGPKGMDKMIVAPNNRLIITNDGASILDEIDVQHPVAKIMVEVAKTQDKEVGDGTTTAVIIAGELLKKAEILLNDKMHPTLIVHGYKKSVDQAIKILNKLSKTVDLENEKVLKNISITSMHSKGVSACVREHFASITIQAVKQVAEKKDEKYFVDIDNIQLIKKKGKSLMDTDLIRGIIVDREVANPGMPKIIKNAKIALIDYPLERALARERPGYGSEIRISKPHQIKAFQDAESKIVQNLVDNIKELGANVVMCGSRIDDVAQYLLAREEIMGIGKVRKTVMEKLSRATGGNIVTIVRLMTEKDLGSCKLVEERKIANDKMVFIQGCEDPKAVCILIRAGLERLVDEAERVLKDSLSVIANVFMKNNIVAGGGAIEFEIARKLKKYAMKIGGKEQLSILAFADSLEVIPQTLSENAGLDPINVLVNLKSLHEREEGKYMGIDVYTGKIKDVMEYGILESLSVKEQAIKSAGENASMILRIDDVVTAAKSKPAK